MLHLKHASSCLLKKHKVLSKLLLNSLNTRFIESKHQYKHMNTSVNHQAQVSSKLNPRLPKTALSLGQEVEGFIVKEIADIPDFQLTAVKLSHQKTKAQYLHLDRNDSNNVFSVNLRTTPFDSTGVAHILEHITLCGSDKFACREVFFKMISRSMATFINAMTGPDYTMYPFATQNPRDFANLLSVYLDSVFKPKLREMDFRAEGWRLEHEDINDHNSPIIIKGVVYNEMKGSLSENNSIFAECLLNTMLPSHTYSVNSGGDPLVIPNLSYADLKKFHSEHYHPTNSRFYTYGTFDLKDHLKYINENYLDKYNSLPQSFLDKTSVPSEPRWSQPKEKQIFGREDQTAPEAHKQSSLVVSQLCCDITDFNETFVLQILSELLVKGPNSAFYKTLVESSLGSGFHPTTGFEPQTKDTLFTVGLQGLSPDSFEKVIQIYNETIDKVINEGFDETHIKSILHNIELNLKHQTANFGLNLLFGLTPLWNHNVNLIDALRVNDRVSYFCGQLKNNPRLLQDKVKQYFKDNTHRLTLTMVPDKDFEEKLNRSEKELIELKVKTLTGNEKKAIYQQGLDLRKFQESEDDISCLPSLKVSDINKTTDLTALSFVDYQSVPIQISDQPTNGVVYFRGLLDIKELSDSQKLLLPLFCGIANRMGTTLHNYQEFDQLVRLKTSGISLDTFIKEAIDSVGSYEEGVAFSLYCLDQNITSMFDILSELLTKVTLNDLNRFKMLVKMIVGNMSHGIVDGGHIYAISLASSLINRTAFRKEELSGLHYINRMKKLVSKDLSPVLDELGQMASILFNKKYLKCACNMTAEMHDTTVNKTQVFINSLSSGSSQTSPLDSNDFIPKNGPNPGIHYILPIPVNFASKAISSVPYVHEDFPKLRVLCNLLSWKYLLPVVREKGGAYGAGVKVSPIGTINFYSYRDPNSVATFDVYDKTLDWLKKNNLTDQDLDEAKLSLFQKLDEPVPPSNRGMRQFLHGISDEMFQHHRSLLLKVTKDDVKFVAEKYLCIKASDGKCSRALIGPDNPNLKLRENESWTTMT